MNKLYYGDNLNIMMEFISDKSIDLIYLDPPFNSNRNYNVLYRKINGRPVREQRVAFCDTWSYDYQARKTEKMLPGIMADRYKLESKYIRFWISWMLALKENNKQLLAYLIYMVPRLLEMKRILKASGSIYLHCDPTASHYLKVMMDGVFGFKNFRNEIIWHYDGPQRPSLKNFGKKHDVILRYSGGESYYADSKIISPSKIVLKEDLDKYRRDENNVPFYDLPRGDYTDASIERLDKEKRIKWSKNGNPRIIYRLEKGDDVPCSNLAKGDYADASNEKWLRKKQIHDVWNDIPSLGQSGNKKEKLGYPTQKPIDLLNRIILASSKKGDIIFDPFCGCGTSVYSANINQRDWIGCDIAFLATKLTAGELKKKYKLIEGIHFNITGIPKSATAARALHTQSPFIFQTWCVEAVEGFPNKKQTGDRGKDGEIGFFINRTPTEMVLSVKGGKGGAGPRDVRELRGVLARESTAELAGLICFNKPTKRMIEESVEAGKLNYGKKLYNRIQFLTISEILEGKMFNTPPNIKLDVSSLQKNLDYDRDAH